MSDQANSDGISGSTDSQQGRGHGRRAVMLGAAAVGAGAVAGMAGSAGTAMASTVQAAPKGAVSPAHSIVVRLPGPAFNIDQTIRVVESVLGQVGCGGCFSGWDISFVHETEFIVNANGVVQPEA